MSLILKPDEIKSALEGHYWQPEEDHYAAIAKAQAKKDAEAFILFYEAWHRGLGEPIACVQFTIRYGVTYRLNFANVFSEWARNEGVL